MPYASRICSIFPLWMESKDNPFGTMVFVLSSYLFIFLSLSSLAFSVSLSFLFSFYFHLYDMYSSFVSKIFLLWLSISFHGYLLWMNNHEMKYLAKAKRFYLQKMNTYHINENKKRKEKRERDRESKWRERQGNEQITAQNKHHCPKRIVYIIKAYTIPKYTSFITNPLLSYLSYS